MKIASFIDPAGRPAYGIVAGDGVKIQNNVSLYAGVVVEDVSRATLPPDFERKPRIHRCWRIRRAP